MAERFGGVGEEVEGFVARGTLDARAALGL